MPIDADAAYRAVVCRDGRFDGHFITAVRSTGIYCRPACPSRTPRRANVEFFATSAAAHAAGYRACRRCLPDAAPGSPEWDLRGDTVGAAMRLIADGLVDREGVTGLAARLGYSTRHVARLLLDEVGAPPLALARARRADTARILLTSTSLPVCEVAFAAGFSSVRQCNDTIRQVYALTPSQLRTDRGSRTVHRGHPHGPGSISLRLRVRTPFAGEPLLAFLAARAVAGVELVVGRHYARSLLLPHGPARIVLTLPPDTDPMTAYDDGPGRTAPPAPAAPEPGTATVEVLLQLADLADLTPAVQRCRRLLDADADPVGIATILSTDPALAPEVRRRPGLRLPGAVDGPEILIRALVGQQVSVAAARTALGRITASAGRALPRGGAAAVPDADGAALDHVIPLRGPPPSPARPDAPDPATLASQLTHLFPSPAALAALSAEQIGGPRRRAAAIIAAATDMAAGTLIVDAGRTRTELTEQLVARHGIGPWTAGYVAMRVLGDPDVLLTGDLALRRGAEQVGLPTDPDALAAAGHRWRPYRSYAGMYLWRACPPPVRRRKVAAP